MICCIRLLPWINWFLSCLWILFVEEFLYNIWFRHFFLCMLLLFFSKIFFIRVIRYALALLVLFFTFRVKELLFLLIQVFLTLMRNCRWWKLLQTQGVQSQVSSKSKFHIWIVPIQMLPFLQHCSNEILPCKLEIPWKWQREVRWCFQHEWAFRMHGSVWLKND